MRFVILILLTAIVSCKNENKVEKLLFDNHIFLHNEKVGQRFFKDSLEEWGRLRSENVRNPGSFPFLEIQKRMNEFSQNWNSPYKIERDRFLTIDKYLKYCEENNLDPEEHIKKL